MDLESRFKNLRSVFDDIQNFQKASKPVLSFLISLNTELLQHQHNDQSQSNPATIFGRIGGAKALLKCMEVLSNNGTAHNFSDELASKCYQEMRNVCWSASDKSLDFCDDCGKCGMFSFLIKELEHLKKVFNKNTPFEDFRDIIIEGFAILMNCSKSINNIELLHDLKVVRLASQYRDMIKQNEIPRSKDIEICCIILQAFIVNENELDLIGEEDDVIDHLVQNLCVALSNPEHRFSGFHSEELIQAIQKLGRNDKNGVKIMQELKEYPIFSLVFEEGLPKEKENTIALLCQLSFIIQLKETIVNDELIINFLQKTILEKSNNEKFLAKLTLFVLNQNEEFNDDHCDTTKVERIEKNDKKLVILCFEKLNRNVAERIKSDIVLEMNCDVYLEGDDDYDDLSFGENEIKTFKKASASLFLLTRRFQDSLHCRAVAKFLSSFRSKELIILPMDCSFEAHGWLKMILAGNERAKFVDVRGRYDDAVRREVHRCLAGLTTNVRKCTADQESEEERDQLRDLRATSNFTEPKKILKPNRRIKSIYRRLKSSGYKVWIDKVNIAGNLIDAMCSGVDNAAVFIMFMSEKYEKSKNCRHEAEYAWKTLQPDDVIPVIVEQGYTPKQWLGFVVGTKLYFELSNNFEEFYQKLVKNLGKRGKHV